MPCAFLDLDDLKGVNDRYGHAEGDRYLAAVAQEVTRVCRQDWDIPARYGGNDFLILFPEAEPSVVDQRMREVNRRLSELSYSGGVYFPMSISHGVVASEGISDAQMLLAAADHQMYQVKKVNEKEKQRQQPNQTKDQSR